jgi:hypothetical protein
MTLEIKRVKVFNGGDRFGRRNVTGSHVPS